MNTIYIKVVTDLFFYIVTYSVQCRYNRLLKNFNKCRMGDEALVPDWILRCGCCSKKYMPVCSQGEGVGFKPNK